MENTYWEITKKCKKVLNILRCLKGSEWGADRTALEALYIGLIGPVLDFGCFVYGSTVKILLNNLEKNSVSSNEVLLYGH